MQAPANQNTQQQPEFCKKCDRAYATTPCGFCYECNRQEAKKKVRKIITTRRKIEQDTKRDQKNVALISYVIKNSIVKDKEYKENLKQLISGLSKEQIKEMKDAGLLKGYTMEEIDAIGQQPIVNGPQVQQPNTQVQQQNPQVQQQVQELVQRVQEVVHQEVQQGQQQVQQDVQHEVQKMRKEMEKEMEQKMKQWQDIILEKMQPIEEEEEEEDSEDLLDTEEKDLEDLRNERQLARLTLESPPKKTIAKKRPNRSRKIIDDEENVDINNPFVPGPRKEIPLVTGFSDSSSNVLSDSPNGMEIEVFNEQKR